MRWPRSGRFRATGNPFRTGLGQFEHGGILIFLGPDWEPVFHGAVAGSWVYVPGAGGSLFKLNKNTGALVTRIKPFGSSIDPNIYLDGPITVSNGNVYYNVIKLNSSSPWSNDVVGSWLVRVAPNGNVSKVSYSTLTPGAPAATDPCTVQFSWTGDPASLPWPPSPAAVAPTIACGSQRSGLNVAPAVAPDGTSTPSAALIGTTDTDISSRSARTSRQNGQHPCGDS